MQHHVVLITLANIFIGTVAVQAQQAYTVKSKERCEGETALVKQKETTTSELTIADADGNILLEQREVTAEIQEFKETIVKRTAGEMATKLERTYSKAQVTKGDKTDDGPLQGKTVLIEKKDGKYIFTYKNGKEVTGAAAAALSKEFSKESGNNGEFTKALLPKHAVRVGETWKIAMPKIVAEFAEPGRFELDAAKSTGHGTLVKAYKKDGRQFGELKFKMEMPIVTFGNGMKFTSRPKMVMDSAVDLCIDGSADAGTMKIKGIVTGIATVPQAPGATATINVSAEIDSSQEEVAKK